MLSIASSALAFNAPLSQVVRNRNIVMQAPSFQGARALRALHRARPVTCARRALARRSCTRTHTHTHTHTPMLVADV